MRAVVLPMVVLAAAAAAWGCTEDPLTGPGPEEGENAASSTVELSVGPGEMASWRDTSYTGFALPSDAGFVVLAAGDGFRSRALLRYTAFPDSVALDTDTLEIEEFRNGRVRLAVDTTSTALPPGGDLTLRVLTLARRFDPDEATWQSAAEGEAWDAPGGDFDREVGRAELGDVDNTVLADTVDVPLGADTDSLLTTWRETSGQPGVAVLVETDGARLPVTGAVLEFDAKPAGRDTTVGFRASTVGDGLPSTFIFDPPAPAPGSLLRLGGLPASRFYLAFRPPTEVEGARLPGSTINRAELVFPPAPAAAPPFDLAGSVTASGIQLLADPFALGPKTPIGDTLSTGTRVVLADSLASGRPLRFEFTEVLRRWASNPDSAGELRVGIRLRPDGQSLGFWEFGSDASEPGLRPFLRVVVTPPSDFDAP